MRKGINLIAMNFSFRYISFFNSRLHRRRAAAGTMSIYNIGTYSDVTQYAGIM